MAFMDMAINHLVSSIDKKKIDLVSELFLQRTGEELNDYSKNRVLCVLPYYSSLDKMREVIMIDGKPAVEFYALYTRTMYYDEISVVYKLATELRYRIIDPNT